MAIPSGIAFIAWEFSKYLQYKDKLLKGIDTSAMVTRFAGDRIGKKKDD